MTSLVNRKEFEYEISYNPINSVIRETPEERRLIGNQWRKASGMIQPYQTCSADTEIEHLKVRMVFP